MWRPGAGCFGVRSEAGGAGAVARGRQGCPGVQVPLPADKAQGTQRLLCLACGAPEQAALGSDLKRVAQALSPAVARGAQEFKFRCLQIKRKGRNASFVWHVAPRSRLLWDKEPLFYLRDKQTERHVRRQLRSLDIEVT